MNSNLAFEIGAVFVFAAMLMFGSSHGLIPRGLRNIGVPVIVGAVLLGFLVWRFWPDLSATMGANVRSLTATQPPPAEPSGPAAAAALHSPAKSGAPAVKGIVIREVVEAPAAPAPAPSAAQPVVVRAPDVSSPSANPSDDSGVKRAAKSVGHFLHIGKRDPPATVPAQ